MASSYLGLIGAKYSDKNCWDVVRDYYKMEFDIDLKHYYDPCSDVSDRKYVESLVYTNEKDFVKVRSPKVGDIIVIKMMGVESHIAVFLGNGQMLHTTKTTGCVIDRVGRWSKLVTGYYTLNPNEENK